MKITVIGAGSWGTTLADLLAHKGEDVRLWVRERDLLAEIKATGENTWYMPGIKLSPNLHVVLDRAQACQGTELFLFVVPSQHFREVLGDFRPHLPQKPAILCASKGVELTTHKTMSQVCEEALAGLAPRYGVLSGPSFAYEVIRRIPTAITLASHDDKLAREGQQAFSTDSLRIYTSKDVIGVELGGAFKNIIAIAAGVSDELGFGSNARAALITRGLAEMSRLGKALKADPKTFMGLSGLGDLVLTCTGDLSRNRQLGKRLAQGRKLMDILGEMKMVAEGVKTTEAVHDLARRTGLDLPITAQVHAVLFEDKDPAQAVRDLMTRSLREE